MILLMLPLTALSVALSLTSPARAADADEKELAELRERIRALEKAIDEQRGISDAPAEIPLDLTTRINAYGAITLAQHEEQPVLGFSLDELIFQYTANLDRKMTMSTEFSLEAQEEGVEVGLEKMEILLAPSAAFQVDAGAFHFILSPWTVTASQGAYRYMTVELPETLVEETGNEYLPVDQVGVEVRGKVPVGFWQLGYGVSLTNGRSPAPGDTVAFGDGNYFKAITGRIGVYSPGGISVSGGAYYDQMSIEEDLLTSDAPITEIIAALAVNWEGGPVEIRSEWFLTLHGVDGASYQSLGGFAYLGVPVKRTTPFIGVNVIQVNPDDPVYAIFTEAPKTAEVVAGFRYELGLHLALKGQFDSAIATEEGSVIFGGQLQLAAGF